MEAVIDGMALGKKVREKKRNLADIDDESFLISLENDKPLILLEPKSL